MFWFGIKGQKNHQVFPCQNSKTSQVFLIFFLREYISFLRLYFWFTLLIKIVFKYWPSNQIPKYSYGHFYRHLALLMHYLNPAGLSCSSEVTLVCSSKTTNIKKLCKSKNLSNHRVVIRKNPLQITRDHFRMTTL